MPLLFSYGTLQQEAVQRSTFGRPLQGHPTSSEELARAYAYESAGYVRVSTRLASGREAWAYTDARFS